MLSNELQEFLKEQFPYDAQKMIFTPEMKLYKDFKMVGEDVEDFLLDFTKTFNVKLGDNFNFKERFYLEFEGSLIERLLLPFTFIQKLINISLFESPKEDERKDLSFAELDRAIKTGVLE
ncbi:DUF1493 family protein [Capnocytophaga felis]|uniref:DUF1493 domain-containing protein n=1 Tax=Capnocytophaga felis TaxID=2267611 RepID=A0A5M4BAR8_9FLAO|nr:DUF1493 family protein [Capnocytophaga felis]GET46683.1 hypothetical protein RCZ01_19850 [Capnocytophaga felis]GET48785.1 hypothetical protein RCZ02_16160 [Capnocytophaga felis]